MKPMQQPPEHRLASLRSVRLSSAEREALRSLLLAKMREARVLREAIPSPWPPFFHAKRFQAALLLGVIIVSYGSSAALAAEGALPGDVLYPVKTRVVEPLARLVAARTPTAKADFEATLLDRRLREAEALLDDEETLDAPLREAVRERIRAQSARAEETERRAGGELPPSVLRSATSTTVTATSSPARLEDDRRPERDSDKRERDKRRTERAVRDVLKEHKRILEKLEIRTDDDDKKDGNDGDGADDEKNERRKKQSDRDDN